MSDHPLICNITNDEEPQILMAIGDRIARKPLTPNHAAMLLIKLARYLADVSQKTDRGSGMKLKPGVDIKGIQPECIVGMMAAQEVCRSLGVPCVITSVLDGKHSENSFHYQGLAFDLRTRDMDDPEVAKAMLRIALPNDWDIVLESDHLHLEHEAK